jgi:hypothetical protein
VGSAVGAASSGVRAGVGTVSGPGVGAGGAAPVGGFAGPSSAAASAGGGPLGDEGGASSGVVGVESGCVGGDGAAGGGSAAGGGGSAGAPTPGAAVSVPGSECSGLSCPAAVGTSTTKAAAVKSASRKIRLMRRVAAPHFRPSLKTSPIRTVRHRLAVAPAQTTFEYSARMLEVFRMSANCGNREEDRNVCIHKCRVCLGGRDSGRAPRRLASTLGRAHATLEPPNFEAHAHTPARTLGHRHVDVEVGAQRDAPSRRWRGRRP